MSIDEHALLAPYALDAVDATERQRFARHLKSCAPCAQELESMRNALAGLGGSAAVSPPPELRVQVLSAARELPQEGATAAATSSAHAEPAPFGRGRTRRRTVLAAAAAAVITGTGVEVWKRARPSDPAVTARSILADPNAERATASYRSSRVTVARKDGRAAVNFDPAPAQPPGQACTAWAVDDAGTAHNAGQLPQVGGAASVLLDGDVGSARAVAFTSEKAGTHPDRPSGTPFVVVPLS